MPNVKQSLYFVIITRYDHIMIFLRLIAIFVLTLVDNAGGAPSTGARRESAEKSFRVSGVPTYYSVNLDGAALTGVGLAFSQQMVVGDDVAFGLNFMQALSSEGGGSALFTNVGVAVSYAITGKLAYRESQLFLDDGEVLSSKGANTGGFRGELVVNQYFFNTEGAAIPFSGVSLNFLYEFSSLTRVSHNLGVGYGNGVSGARIATFSQVFWGMKYIL